MAIDFSITPYRITRITYIRDMGKEEHSIFTDLSDQSRSTRCCGTFQEFCYFLRGFHIVETIDGNNMTTSKCGCRSSP